MKALKDLDVVPKCLFFVLGAIVILGVIFWKGVVMPFKSQAQRRFMFARMPALAKKWAKKTKKMKKLPERKGTKVKRRRN